MSTKGIRPTYDFALITMATVSNNIVRHAMQRCAWRLMLDTRAGIQEITHIEWRAASGSLDTSPPPKALTPGMRDRVITRMRGQLQELVWDRVEDGQLPLILSYLPSPHFELFAEADDLLGLIARRPFADVGGERLAKILAAEIESYGVLEQRR